MSFRDDPESLLRRPRKAREARETAQAQHRLGSPPPRQQHILAKSIEDSLAEEHRRVDQGDPEEYSDERTPLSSQDTGSEDTDPEQAFNLKWGYLPPLDEEALAVIDAILADPGMGKNYKRIGAEMKEFPEGLRFRNVFEKESPDADPRASHIKSLAPEKPISETEEERKAHEQLWAMDQVQCKKASNEALFQRTLMMSLIARHFFIYDKENTDPSNQGCLDFSVEETWSCPPMPTRAYTKHEKFLTQPKPDLAVCFRREAIILDPLWRAFPKATMRLACYENAIDATERLFHFFTIEAKKTNISADDDVGKRQSLNNASQALHNMFELFRDAGAQHVDDFFTKVRFFSVVASSEGLTVRIHRATRAADGWDSIIPDYPLKFTYRVFFTIQRKDFDRKTVLETFEKILIGYGANELRPMLRKAAEAIMDKLKCDPEGERSRQKTDFYRHGQIDIAPESRNPTSAPNSRRPTPGVGPGQSTQNSIAMTETTRSFEIARSGLNTPTLLRPLSTQAALTDSQKRLREDSVDSVPARSTRQRNE